MISSIKNQNPNQTTTSLEQQQHENFDEEMLIMPSNNHEKTVYSTTMATKSPTQLHQNYADVNTFTSKNNNNNNKIDYRYKTVNNTTPETSSSSVTTNLNSNETTNGFIMDNNLISKDKNEKYIITQTTPTTIKTYSTKFLSHIDDTQMLNKNYFNNKLQNFIITSNIPSVVTSPVKKTTLNASDIPTIRSVINNSKLLYNNLNKSDILVNSIPINNAKDYNIYEKTINNISEKVQHLEQHQQHNNNNLVSQISNQFSHRNGLLINTKNISNINNNNNSNNNSNNNINNNNNNNNNSNNDNNNNNNNNNNKSALFNSFNKSEIDSFNNNNKTAIQIKSAIQTSNMNSSSPFLLNSQPKILTSSFLTTTPASQQLNGNLKFLTTTALHNSSQYNTKILNNIRISSFNKLPDVNNKTAIVTVHDNKNNTNNNNILTTTISSATKTNEETNNSHFKTSPTKRIKPVGFISLEQNGWNLNFITTTTLAPPTTSSTSGSTKLDSPATPVKVSTINSSSICSGNNTISSLNSSSSTLTDNKSKTNQIPNGAYNKNAVNNLVNSAMVNRSLIEDVHNYSKKCKRFPAECISTTNSSVEESDEEDEADDDNDEDDDYEIGAVNGEEEEEEEEQEPEVNIVNNKFDYHKFLTINNNKNKRIQKSQMESTFRTGGSRNGKKLDDRIQNIIADNKVQNNNKDDDRTIKTHKQLNSNELANGEDTIEQSHRPEHHARRPMNAFLIFCKRHRAIVRDKYKNVENRQVTKILGEWWENMSPDEKSSYTNLAKEYKDAFLSANPNFKWYKLPAPPLRTLSMRPCNSMESSTEESSPSKQKENLKDVNDYVQDVEMPMVAAKRMTSDKKESGNVGVFKLADENQMGRLSSLMTDNISSNGNNNHEIFLSVKSEKNNDSEDLQYALSETSKFISLAIPKSKMEQLGLEPFEKMRNHANKMQLSIKGNKRKHTDPNGNEVGNKKVIRDNSFSSSEEDNWLRKPSRSCKGKKYQELVSSGQIATSAKKIKKTNTNSFVQSKLNVINKESSSDSDGAANVSKTDINRSSVQDVEKSSFIDENLLNTNQLLTELCDDNNQLLMQSTDCVGKPFDTNAFDLESKIMALPAQDLEEYLLKKQESKCKKKIASKRRKNINSKKSAKHSGTPSATVAFSQKTSNNQQHKNDADQSQKQVELKKEQCVGSKKRKARKESITRRDLNALYGTAGGQIKTDIKSGSNWIDMNDIKMIEEKNELKHNGFMNGDVLKSEISGVHDNLIERNQQIMTNSDNLAINNNIEISPAISSNTDLLILAEVASNFDE